MNPKLIDDAGNIARTANSTLRDLANGDIEDAKHSALMAAFYAMSVLEKLCGTEFEFFELWQQAEAIKLRHDVVEVRA